MSSTENITSEHDVTTKNDQSGNAVAPGRSDKGPTGYITLADKALDGTVR